MKLLNYTCKVCDCGKHKLFEIKFTQVDFYNDIWYNKTNIKQL